MVFAIECSSFRPSDVILDEANLFFLSNKLVTKTKNCPQLEFPFKRSKQPRSRGRNTPMGVSCLALESASFGLFRRGEATC
eukprot:TRINITY_DN5250_c0_g1_i1.p2 TRINITY_DN5250_c0_g1~~TRINITY_DN5250_c0_g1_i1.p2  ORF type:complete len:81 (-),score=2.87 TRINITY_DN5250_c0_g1_i1:322-564(-)